MDQNRLSRGSNIEISELNHFQMGETRRKKPSKRSVKASSGKTKSHLPSPPSSATQTASEASSYPSSQLAEVTIHDGNPRACIIQPTDPTLLDIRKTAERGIGVFAARKIPAGTLVVAETPLIRLTRAQEHSLDGEHEALKESTIKQQYQALPLSLRKGYDKLFDTEKPQFSRHKSIFYSNCYNLDQHSEQGGACIGLLASRINHACGGHNVQLSFADHASLAIHTDEDDTDESESASSTRDSFDTQLRTGIMLMHATKDIPKGKELLSNYLSPYMVSQARQNELQMHYKFTCDCSACLQQGFWAESDERRSQMRRLKTSIEQSEAAFQAHLKTKHDSNGAKSGKLDLVVMQEVASAVEALSKLANLLIKEGLQGHELVSVYRDLTKWSFRNGDQTVGRRWAAKERESSIICFGAGSKQVAEIDHNTRMKGEMSIE